MGARRVKRGEWKLAGFSLLELLAVVLMVSVVMGIGIGMMRGSEGSKLRSGADQMAAMVDRGRTLAISGRKPVLMAMVGGGELGFADQESRLGLFELAEFPVEGPVSGRLLERWRALPDGIVFLDAAKDGLANPRTSQPLPVAWKDGSDHSEIRGLVFGPRGGLLFPEGSDAVVLRIATGRYVEGKGEPVGDSGRRSLRVGRAVARPWNLDD